MLIPMTRTVTISTLLLIGLMAGVSLRTASAADFPSAMGRKAVAPVLVAGFASMSGREAASIGQVRAARSQAALAAFLLTVRAGCGAGNCRPTAPAALAGPRPARDDGS